jgi:hypothetical protein
VAALCGVFCVRKKRHIARARARPRARSMRSPTCHCYTHVEQAKLFVLYRKVQCTILDLANAGLGQSDNVTQLDWNRSARSGYTRRPSTPLALQAVNVVVKGNGNAQAGLAWYHWRQCVSVVGSLYNRATISGPLSHSSPGPCRPHTPAFKSHHHTIADLMSKRAEPCNALATHGTRRED